MLIIFRYGVWCGILMILPMCQVIFVYLNMFLDPGISERVLCNHPCLSMVRLSIHGPSVHLLDRPPVGLSFRARADFWKSRGSHKWRKDILDAFLKICAHISASSRFCAFTTLVQKIFNVSDWISHETLSRWCAPNQWILFHWHA